MEKRTLIEKGKNFLLLLWCSIRFCGKILFEILTIRMQFTEISWDFLSPGKPSRVIHIRNIPNEASDPEVMNLGQQFGRVTNVLVLKGKNQAFLEMADEISATAMVSVFNTTPPTVRGRTVYVQFSNHRELKTDQNHSITVSAEWYILDVVVSNANNGFVRLIHQTPASGSPLPLVGNDPTSQLVATHQNGTGGANTVLRYVKNFHRRLMKNISGKYFY